MFILKLFFYHYLSCVNVAFYSYINNIDFNVLFHSYKHADFLRKKAVEVGLEYSGAYQETPIEFIKRNLKR